MPRIRAKIPDEFRFRSSDTPSIRAQKLEIFRQWVSNAIENIPEVDPTETINQTINEYITQNNINGFTEATNAEVWAGLIATAGISPNRLFAAAASVLVPYAATITLDFNTGINFHTGVLTGAVLFANPTNMKPGQSGRVATWGAQWTFPGGVDMALSTAPNAVDIVNYFVHTATEIEASYVKAFA
jgi:hypothetical protein